MDIAVGDTILTRKQHPCGAASFEVLRVGMDFKIRCTGLWPRGHAAPGEDREEHQKGHQTGPGIAQRHSTFRNCFVRRTA